MKRDQNIINNFYKNNYLPFFIMSPPNFIDKDWVIKCSNNHTICILNPLFISEKKIFDFCNILESEDIIYGLRLPISRISILNKIIEHDIKKIKYIFLIDNVDKENINYKQYSQIINKLQQREVKIFYEVTDINILDNIINLGIDGFVACGNEGSGLVSKLSSFILVNYLLSNFNLPVIGYGGVGYITITGFIASGCIGVILDSILYQSIDYPGNSFIRKILKNFDATQIIEISKNFNRRLKFFTKNKITLDKINNSVDVISLIKSDSDIINNIYDFNDDYNENKILFFGNDIILSNEFENVSISEIIKKIYLRVKKFIDNPGKNNHFLENSPLANKLGVKYPVIQGSMANISDTSQFIKIISNNNIFPVVALGSLPPEKVGNILKEVEANIGNNPYGVGIVGLKINQKTYEKQLEIINQYKSQYIIIGAGSVNLAKELQDKKFTVFLHTPYLAHFIQALKNDVSGLILEGNESGGHIGSLSSLILWEQILFYLLNTNESCKINKTLIFAGGIFNEISTAFISGMIFDLNEH
ncbi:MAG: hypothetical protein KAT05_10210, partial [Spirochaetes bacterium]|nr:hypothetical protein [Spirochaetota bacterium]